MLNVYCFAGVLQGNFLEYPGNIKLIIWT